MSEYRTTYDRVFKGANENFKGATLNEEKHNAYKTILKLAKKLSEDHSDFEEINYGFTESTSERRNAVVYIETEPPASFSDDKAKTLAAMAQLADDITITARTTAKIRMAFGVRDIWSE